MTHYTRTNLQKISYELVKLTMLLHTFINYVIKQQPHPCEVTRNSETNYETHFVHCAMAWLPLKHAPPHMCYHAEFGISRSNRL